MASTAQWRARYPDWRLAVKIAASFWLLYFVLQTMRTFVVDHPGVDDHQFVYMARRFLVVLLGFTLTGLVYVSIRTFGGARLRRQIAAALLCAIPVALSLAAVAFWLFNIYDPPDPWWYEYAPDQKAYKIASYILDGGINWFFFYSAWAALYLAITYAAQMVEAERNVSRFRAEAQAAQIRALRYQVNPHFLFNTLNSLSSLTMSGRTGEAETMLMNLSTFFRSTLATDPGEDVPLAEEIKLQRLYLDIERVRFPERLRTRFDVPEELESARVPALILQPLVENAIKYGVARSRRPVNVAISAYEEAGSLHLKVSDDGDPLTHSDPGHRCDGTGTGLRNVCDRLSARFPGASGCFFGPDPAGGYTVHIILPVIRDERPQFEPA